MANETIVVKITEESKQLFAAYVADAPNWSGTPLVGGNVGGTKEQRGNLTQLKRAGLLKTFNDEGCIWVLFTKKGCAYAKQENMKDAEHMEATAIEDEEVARG